MTVDKIVSWIGVTTLDYGGSCHFSNPVCPQARQQDREPEERTEEGANKGELIDRTRSKCAEEQKVNDGVRGTRKVCSLESTKTHVIKSPFMSKGRHSIGIPS